MKLIDVHCHVFPENIAAKAVAQLEEYYHFKWTGTGLLDDLLRNMDKANVEKAIIFSCATKASQVEAINTYIHNIVESYPSRFIGLGTIHPDYENFDKEFIRMKELNLKGIKLHPDFQSVNIDDPRLLDIYGKLDSSTTLLIHMGDVNNDYSNCQRLARVLEMYPQLTIIAAHMGGYMKWDDALKYLVGKNVYFDCSSSMPWIGKEKMLEIINKHTPDKILFASDYPSMLPQEVLTIIKNLDLSEIDVEKICYTNAKKLFNI